MPVQVGERIWRWRGTSEKPRLVALGRSLTVETARDPNHRRPDGPLEGSRHNAGYGRYECTARG